MTASPEELRLMLYDAAIKFIHQGREALTSKDYETVHRCFRDARNIIMEFITSMDHSQDPDLCRKMTALYTFMYRRLVDAGIEKNPDYADEALKLLEYDRETWVLLMEKVAEERNSGSAPSAVNKPAEVPGSGTPGVGRMLSVEG